jgi:hypothetical protein
LALSDFHMRGSLTTVEDGDDAAGLADLIVSDDGDGLVVTFFGGACGGERGLVVEWERLALGDYEAPGALAGAAHVDGHGLGVVLPAREADVAAKCLGLERGLDGGGGRACRLCWQCRERARCRHCSRAFCAACSEPENSTFSPVTRWSIRGAYYRGC